MKKKKINLDTFLEIQTNKIAMNLFVKKKMIN